MKKSPCSSRAAAGLAAMQRGPETSRDDHCYDDLNLLSLFSNLPGVYKPPAVPSDAALGAHYPAGTRVDSDIQAATVTVTQLDQDKEKWFIPPRLVPSPE